jgi:hypothetical protein
MVTRDRRRAVGWLDGKVSGLREAAIPPLPLEDDSSVNHRDVDVHRADRIRIPVLDRPIEHIAKARRETPFRP